MSVFLVRHGQSFANICEDTRRNNPDSLLTDYGEEQCEQLHKKLEKLKIKDIWCSPLIRAVDTCKILMRDRTDVKYIDCAKEYRWSGEVGGGWDDSWTIFLERVHVLLEDITEWAKTQESNSVLLIVSHQRTISTLLQMVVYDGKKHQWPKNIMTFPVENTSVSVLNWKNNKKLQITNVNRI